MPAWWTSSTLYKGLFILVLGLIALEYLFGSITESKHFFVYNATRIPAHQQPPERPSLGRNSALYKTLLFKNNHHNNSKIIIPSSLSSAQPNSTNASSWAAMNISRNTISSSSASSSNRHWTSSSSTEQPGGPPPLDAANGANLTLIPTFDVNPPESESSGNINSSTALPLCPELSSNLRGRIDVVKSPVPTVQELESRFAWLQPGGHWAPENCRVPKKVAIIIPFRCRGEHLLLFLQHMHPFLKRQQLDYTIFIVEQDGDNAFNRAMLMNVGFTEALKMRNYDCFIFHDIDLLPEDDRNMYTCPPGQPRHMSVAVDVLKYRLPYSTIFGGVCAINRDQFRLLNGFSNSYWGWGGEDDDLSNRIRYHNLFISRYPVTIARYTMLTHKKDKPSPNRYDLLKHGHKRFETDGLNSLKYKLVQSKKNLLYTWFLVSIEMPS